MRPRRLALYLAIVVLGTAAVVLLRCVLAPDGPRAVRTDEAEVAAPAQPTRTEAMAEHSSAVAALRQSLLADQRARMPIGDLIVLDSKSTGPTHQAVSSLILSRKAEALPALSRSLQSGSTGEKLHALLFLQKVAPWREASPQVLAVLLDTNSEPAVRLRAVATSGVLGIRQATGEIAKLAATSEDASMREVCAFALGMLGGQDAEASLVKALNDRSSRVRLAAAEGLGRLGNRAGVSTALALSKDAEWSVRMLAAQALGHIGGDAAEARVREMASRDASPGVRASAAVAIHQAHIMSMSAAERIQDLAKSLDDPHDEIALWAAKTLAERHRETAASILTSRLHSAGTRVRPALVRFLLLLDEPQAKGTPK